MILIRAAIFTVALAFGFIFSGNLDGIEKIREGSADLATSIVSAFQNQELSESADINSDSSGVVRYLSPTTAKYLLIAVGLIFGIFMATLIGAGVMGLLGGVLFSPEIASVPVLADAAVSVSTTVSALWADLMEKISGR